MSVFKVPTINWNLAASFFKYSGYTSMANYGLFYFNYYGNPDTYAILNVVVASIGGIISPLVTAMICDKYEPHYIRIKPFIAAG